MRLPNGWRDYHLWQENDRKILQRVNEVIRDAQRSPFSGIGKPEPLGNSLKGWWSRHIAQGHRLIYRVEGDSLLIMQCRFHYDD